MNLWRPLLIILGFIEIFLTGFDGKSSDVWVDSHQQEKADKQAVIDQVSKGFVGCFLPENGEGATIGHGLFNVSNFVNLDMKYLLYHTIVIF